MSKCKPVLAACSRRRRFSSTSACWSESASAPQFKTSLGTLTGLTINGDLTLSASSPNIYGSSASSIINIASQRTALNTGVGLQFQSYNAANAATTRFQLTSGVATAVATWSNVTHTGIVLSGTLDANSQNISNGGTVTAITVTASGSGYTSIPSCVISAPTTAGGVQATD